MSEVQNQIAALNPQLGAASWLVCDATLLAFPRLHSYRIIDIDSKLGKTVIWYINFELGWNPAEYINNQYGLLTVRSKLGWSKFRIKQNKLQKLFLTIGSLLWSIQLRHCLPKKVVIRVFLVALYSLVILHIKWFSIQVLGITQAFCVIFLGRIQFCPSRSSFTSVLFSVKWNTSEIIGL